MSPCQVPPVTGIFSLILWNLKARSTGISRGLNTPVGPIGPVGPVGPITLHPDPASAMVPAVSPNFTQSFSVVVVGPVVIPAPVPARTLLLVTVEAVAAMGTWPAVMPERPPDGIAVLQLSNVPVAV